MSEYTDWQTFSNNLIRYSKPELWLDLSLMDLPEDLVKTKKKSIDKSLDEVKKLKRGPKSTLTKILKLGDAKWDIIG